jgi:NDMA-dependent alcohol dehydrogenase
MPAASVLAGGPAQPAMTGTPLTDARTVRSLNSFLPAERESILQNMSLSGVHVKTKAALSYVTNEPWDFDKHQWVIEELDIAPLGADDVMVRLPYTSVCHTDLHLITGDLTPTMLPMIGGHEGAGIVEEVGTNVTHVKPGDHVILSLVPACGVCRFCRMGRSNMCDLIATVLSGRHPDGRDRYSNAAGPVGQWSLLGTFAEHVVVPKVSAIKIDDSIPLDKASMVGCAVTTGFGAAVDKAGVRVGDSVLVWGCGGVGLSAVQGAVVAGAADVYAVDTNDMKLDVARSFGATVTLNPNRDGSPNELRDETAEKVLELTNWQGVDCAIMSVDYVTPELIGAAFAAVRRGGTLVVVGVTNARHQSIHVMPLELTFTEKTISGCIYGSGNPILDLPRNLKLYQRGRLKLDEMVTNVYPLEDVNHAFEDLLGGKNVKSILRF